MASDRPRYYTVKPSGLGFWQPSPKMRSAGFKSVACGIDGPDAWAIAESQNAQWDEIRRDADAKNATRKNLDEISRLFAKIADLGQRVQRDSDVAAFFAEGLRGYARAIEDDLDTRSKSSGQTHIPGIDWNETSSGLTKLEKTEPERPAESDSDVQSEESDLNATVGRNANGTNASVALNGFTHQASRNWLAWFSDFPTEESEPESVRSIG
jgi:hypothetical protein